MTDKRPNRSALRRNAKELKIIMKERNRLPKYEVWTDPKVIANSNCYAWAFNIPVQEDEQSFFGFLGWTIGKYEAVQNKEVSIQRLLTDIARMGFKAEQTMDAGIPEKGFKIALFLFHDGDFHFMRMDEDGTWSEKDGYGGEIRKVLDEEGNPILPEEIDYGCNESMSYFWIYK